MFDDDGVTLAGGDFFQRFVDHQACSEMQSPVKAIETGSTHVAGVVGCD